MSYNEPPSSSDPATTVSAAATPNRPERGCPQCHRTVRLRELRDYGTPEQPSAAVTRISRWECECGWFEVLNRAPVV